MKIRRPVLESIIEHARESSPRECCGILLAGAGDRTTVTHALPAENAAEDCPKRAYVLGHEAHLKAVNMEAAGTGYITGYYHSHPNGEARPSPEDNEKSVPGVVYLIVGLRDGSVHCEAWRSEGDSFVSHPLEVTE